jgi:polysaccharide pyruvyl transferase WcaK-like protein
MGGAVTPPRPPRVVVCNDGVGSPNKGDQAIWKSMQLQFARHLPDVEFVPVPFSRVRTPTRLLRFISTIRAADAFVLGGGHPFQDLTSQLFLGFALGAVLAARLLGRPVFCYAVGAGPFISALGRRLTPVVLGRNVRLTVRDPVSANILRDLGVPSAGIEETADPAFTLPPASPRRARAILDAAGVPTDRPLVVVAPRRWFHYTGSLLPTRPGRASPGARIEELTTSLVRCLDDLVASGHHLVFVAMRSGGERPVAGQDDDLYAAELRSRMTRPEAATLLPCEPLSPEEISSVFGLARFAVCVRMHAMIFASTHRVPTLGVAYGRSKGEGFFTKLGMPSQCWLDIDDATGDRLLERMRWIRSNEEMLRATLDRVIPRVVEEAERTPLRLARMLGRGPE